MASSSGPPLSDVKRPVGRPRIGPNVDFCVPEKMDAEVRRLAKLEQVTVDAMYRLLLEAGLNVLAGIGWDS